MSIAIEVYEDELIPSISKEQAFVFRSASLYTSHMANPSALQAKKLNPMGFRSMEELLRHQSLRKNLTQILQDNPELAVPFLESKRKEAKAKDKAFRNSRHLENS